MEADTGQRPGPAAGSKRCRQGRARGLGVEDSHMNRCPDMVGTGISALISVDALTADYGFLTLPSKPIGGPAIGSLAQGSTGRSAPGPLIESALPQAAPAVPSTCA